MPRQHREEAPVARVPRGRAGVRLTSVLVIILVSSTAGAWYFGGNATRQTQDAKQIFTLAPADIQKVSLKIGEQTLEFERDADGKISPRSVIATPTPAPVPTALAGAPSLPPVKIDYGTRIESYLKQIGEQRIDRVLVSAPSNGEEYGLAKPLLVVVLTPKSGSPVTVSIGSGNPQGNAVYVRREPPGDIVLVSRYTIDEFAKFATSMVPATP